MLAEPLMSTWTCHTSGLLAGMPRPVWAATYQGKGLILGRLILLLELNKGNVRSLFHAHGYGLPDNWKCVDGPSGISYSLCN